MYIRLPLQYLYEVSMTHLRTPFGSCHSNPELVTLVTPLGTCLTPHPHWLVCMAGGAPPGPTLDQPTPVYNSTLLMLCSPYPKGIDLAASNSYTYMLTLVAQANEHLLSARTGALHRWSSCWLEAEEDRAVCMIRTQQEGP